MRVTIVRKDGFISVDDVGFSGLDLSFLPENIHAVQWYDTVGEVEMYEPHPYKVVMAPSQQIDTLAEYQQCLDLWNATKVAHDAAVAEAEAAYAAELARLQAQQSQQPQP
jgi:hypothetical protein